MGSPEDTGPWQSSSMNSSNCFDVRQPSIPSGTSCFIEEVETTVVVVGESGVIVLATVLILSVTLTTCPLVPAETPLLPVPLLLAAGCFQTTLCTGMP